MRRLVLLAACLLIFCGVVTPASAETGGAIVSIRDAWIVAKGAAAEARLRVTCVDGVSPAIVNVDLRSGEAGWLLASGYYSRLTCDGAPHDVVVPLAVGGSGQKLTAGFLRIDYKVTNCLDISDCFQLQGGEMRTVERAPFATPSSDDLGADLELVRHRVTSTGDLRLVYDLTCRVGGTTYSALSTVVSQAGAGGRLVRGSAQAPLDEGVLLCGPEPRRYKLLVQAGGGNGFSSGPVFVDTTVGEWYEDATYARDRRVLRLEVPTS
jgi:hypothetical protein